VGLQLSAPAGELPTGDSGGMTGNRLADVPEQTTAPHPKVLGMLAQAEGERAYRDRHLVFASAETRQVGSVTQYLSADGEWCVRPGRGRIAGTCRYCRDLLRTVAVSRRACPNNLHCQGKTPTVTHKTSMLTRLIELRRRYTGESHSAAVPEVRAALGELCAEEREQLRDSLELPNPQQLPPRLRAVVIPDAATPPQRFLETAVLLAVGRIGFTAPGAIRAVAPSRDELILRMDPEAVGLLLRGLMPRETDTGLDGVPGLRVYSDRRNLRLYLHNTDTVSAVRIASVSVRQFLDLLERIDVDRPAGDPLRWLGNDPAPLQPAEQEPLPVRGYVDAASDLLRRIRLFPTIPEVMLLPAENAVAVDWQHGASTAKVLMDLQHPAAGLPAGTIAIGSPPTHLVLGSDGGEVRLRGPDLRCAPTQTVLAPAVRPTLENHTVLTTHEGRPRWFRASVEEAPPTQVPVMSDDHDAMVTLARHAGLTHGGLGLR
jgi:hypothetical protein